MRTEARRRAGSKGSADSGDSLRQRADVRLEERRPALHRPAAEPGPSRRLPETLRPATRGGSAVARAPTSRSGNGHRGQRERRRAAARRTGRRRRALVVTVPPSWFSPFAAGVPDGEVERRARRQAADAVPACLCRRRVQAAAVRVEPDERQLAVRACVGGDLLLAGRRPCRPPSRRSPTGRHRATCQPRCVVCSSSRIAWYAGKSGHPSVGRADQPVRLRCRCRTCPSTHPT